MVFDLMHEDIMVLGVPKMKDYCIAIVYYLSHSFNVCYAVVLLEGFRCSRESDFTCCEYSHKVIGRIGVYKIELGMMVVLNLEFLFLNPIFLLYLFQNGLV